MKLILNLIILSFTIPSYTYIVERIVAKVNNDIITGYDVIKKMNDMRSEARISKKRLPYPLRKHALDKLINAKLVMQTAKKEGVMVTRIEIEDRIDRIRKSKNMTIDQFKRELKKEKSSYQKFYEKMKINIVMRKLFSKGKNKVKKPTDKEIAAFYRKNKYKLGKSRHVKHLFVRKHVGMGYLKRAKQEAKIDKIKAALKKNRWNFSNIARRYADSWKDYGFIKASKDLPLVVRLAFSPKLKVGKVIEFYDYQVKLNGIPNFRGFHALFIVRSKPLPLKDIKNGIYRFVYEKNMTKAIDVWVKKLRKNAHVVINK